MPKTASWIWQSISAVRKEVKMEAIRKIGNGKSTRIWEDNWIPDSPNGKPSVAKPQGCQLRMVSDLISNHSWNRVLILKTFYSQDAEQILRIPISVIGKEDSFYWKHSQHGQYTVQSGYKVWMKEKNQMDYMTRKEAGTSYEGNISKSWKVLWKQKLVKS